MITVVLFFFCLIASALVNRKRLLRIVKYCYTAWYKRFKCEAVLTITTVDLTIYFDLPSCLTVCYGSS